jgi:hypothetical protein
MTGTEVDRESASYAEGMRAGKRVAAKEKREIFHAGATWAFVVSDEWDEARAEALLRWPDEEVQP